MLDPPPSTDRNLRAAGARGMTVLELSIVIVILGVATLLVLRGLLLVESAKGFIVSYEIEQIRNKVSVYEAEYKALPGKDDGAARRWGLPNPSSMVLGAEISYAGDEGLHGKLAEVLSPNGEQYMAWRHLRAAKLLDGDPNIAGASAAPENPFGGIYGFDEGNLGQTHASLCATRIPGRAAERIDQRLDDGQPGKGLIVATSQYDPVGALNHFDAPDKGPYNYEKTYIICLPMLP